ncbi:MAG: SHOCT domain-containing protein [Bacteroidota bacterium]|nr:SHOCT domain-containing protein [Bacteroidota bacterium]
MYYNYGGMHLFWWFIWVFFLIWIFATPWAIPGQRSKKETPLDLLKKSYARGEIDKIEYEEKKKIILEIR